MKVTYAPSTAPANIQYLFVFHIWLVRHDPIMPFGASPDTAHCHPSSVRTGSNWGYTSTAPWCLANATHVVHEAPNAWIRARSVASSRHNAYDFLTWRDGVTLPDVFILT